MHLGYVVFLSLRLVESRFNPHENQEGSKLCKSSFKTREIILQSVFTRPQKHLEDMLEKTVKSQGKFTLNIYSSILNPLNNSSRPDLVSIYPEYLHL